MSKVCFPQYDSIMYFKAFPFCVEFLKYQKSGFIIYPLVGAVFSPCNWMANYKEIAVHSASNM